MRLVKTLQFCQVINWPLTIKVSNKLLRRQSIIKYYRVDIQHKMAKGNKMANEGYHEPINELTDETKDMHRAITSLMEELEAVDWYNQRVDACKDDDLKQILKHNRDEEKEHAAMVLEWIRRKDPIFDIELKGFLFTNKPIAHK